MDLQFHFPFSSLGEILDVLPDIFNKTSFNISAEISIKNLAIMIAKLVGFEGSISWNEKMPNGTPRKKLDTSILDKLGWQSKTNLEEGIKLTLKAYNEDLQKNRLRI